MAWLPRGGAGRAAAGCGGAAVAARGAGAGWRGRGSERRGYQGGDVVISRGHILRLPSESPFSSGVPHTSENDMTARGHIMTAPS